MENKSINNDVKINDDDKALTEIINIIQSHRHKFFFNQYDELKIEEKYKVSFDKNKLIENIKNSKNFNTDTFSIDFFLDDYKNKYDGKIDLNFGDTLDEYNEKELFYSRKIRFEDNCPYGAEITNLYVNHDDFLCKDSYIELHIFNKNNINHDFDPNLSYKDNILNDIHKRIEKIKKEEKS